MVSFANWPISRKLRSMTAAGALMALLMAGTAFLLNDLRLYRIDCADDLRSMADIIGSNVTAALEFNDRDTAREILSSLREIPSVERAVLFDDKQRPFAAYNKAGTTATEPPHEGEHGAHFSADGYLDLLEPVVSDGRPIGILAIRTNLDELWRHIWNYCLIAVGVLTVSLLAGTLVTRQLQQYFTVPVLDLANAMQLVETHGDYGRRVEERSADELGVLCRGFNRMLAQVQAARQELQAAHDQLEDRVTQRTIELREALHAAEASNRAKSQFLANMSHEIRTPMTAILGYADLLKDDEPLSNKGLDQVEVVRRNGQHLLHVINDILDVSKIEAGKMTVERVPCEPCRIVADVLSLMRPRAREAGLTLEASYQTDFPEQIETDPVRLQQILTNLISNAIKFTQKGRVELRIGLTHSSQNEPLLRFEVVDTGIGIAPEQAARIFDPFMQADDTMTRKYGGTGLGLTISRSLARLLGGDVTLVSRVGWGSTFTVTVATGPIDEVRMVANCRECESPESEAADRAAIAAARPAALTGRILLVEDGQDNQLLISTILRKAGAEVSVAENGKLGMDQALAAASRGQPFDLILLDMQMPVMDGYTAARELRAAGYRRPIVALTAHAMSHDEQKCLDAGCDGYTSKPINRQGLLALVRDYLDRQHEAASR